MTKIIKQWVETNVLAIEEDHDARSGRDVKIVTVGEWIHREETGL